MGASSRKTGDALGLGINAIVATGLLLLLASFIHKPLQGETLLLVGVPTVAGALLAVVAYFSPSLMALAR